ncbi:MAG TPA: hypothetical protein VLX91_12520 [Candidatus Acidoferrales bacterium]|nr:hypothetical protein [Candidatus Acidoferrales bacterium]
MERAADKRGSVGTFLVGVLLLGLGVLLLMSRAGVLSLDFERIIAFMVLLSGGYEAITAFASSNHGRLFWGSALFLAGLLVLLVAYDLVPGAWNQIWPSVLIIPGLSFLMLFFSNVKEYRLLVIAVLFVAFGWIGMMIAKGDFNFSDRLFGLLRFIVSAAIVLAGFYLVWKNFFRRKY